jgi:hypothetical protein
MTPQVQFNGVERVAQATPAPGAAPIGPPLAEAPRRAMTEAERQGMAMGWIGMAFGIFLTLGLLALWAAVALHAGFAGWLVGMAVLGVAMAVVAVAIGYFLLRPR